MSFEEGSPLTPLSPALHGRPRSDSTASAKSSGSSSGKKKEGAKGLFTTERPGNAVQGISQATNNAMTTAIAAPAVLVAAPLLGASNGARQGDHFSERAVNCISGFGEGVSRAVVGSAMIPVAGTFHAASSLRQGAVEPTNIRPGEGSTLEENISHLTEQPFTSLITNTPPENHQGEEYQFFYQKDPGSVIASLGTASYNSTKGFIAGTTMLVACPVKEAKTGAKEKGLAGFVGGLGTGLTTGIVGGVSVATAGLVTGGLQVSQGLTSKGNITNSKEFTVSVGEVVMRSSSEPVFDLVGMNGPAEEGHLEDVDDNSD